MKTYGVIVLMLCFFLKSVTGVAQVDDVKRKSAERSSHGSGRETGGGSSSSSSSYIAFDFFFRGIAGWQSQKLQNREQVPTMVSLELMLQGAVQPSSYYIIHPRLRANWGLLSTDFRFNYLVEEDIEGTKVLRTDDWQVLQFNIVTARNVGFRIGGGLLHEAYSGNKTFSEWTMGLTLQSNDLRLGGMTEYRWAEVRKEWNAQFQFRIIDTGSLHGFASIGVVYQRYYDVINVWGIQTGLVFKLHR